MPEQMKENGLGTVTALEDVTVSPMIPPFRIKNVAEHFPAKILQKRILRFKMGVKGRPSHIRTFDDLPYRDLRIILLRKKLCKGAEDRFSRLHSGRNGEDG